MIVVSDDFKNAMKQPVKELQAFIENDVNVIRDDTDLISYKISGDGGPCTAVMRKFEAKYLGDHNLLGSWVTSGFGVRLPTNDFEYLRYGSFKITETTTAKDTEETSIVGYDRMISSMIAYVPIDATLYPMTLYNYAKTLCNAIGLELGNTEFTVNNDLIVSQELFANINGITYRDIFTQIAQATASTCIIGNDDKLYFKPIKRFDISPLAIIGQAVLGQDRLGRTIETLTYDNMFKLKLGDKYGEINSVVLSRTPQEDNVYLRDEESITLNGLTEFKIENNEFLDKNRETYIIPIYNALNGVSYYPFESTTEGLGWYEIGDSLNIISDTGDEFKTYLFNFSISIDGSLKETLKTTAETKTQTQYQYATSIQKRVKNTEIITNRQEQYIKQLVSDMYDEDGVINEKYTQIFQDINNIVSSVQNSGGNNLIINSVMFAYDNENNPNNWELSGDGTVTMQSDTEALKNGGISGHSFTLLNKTVRQTIRVRADNPEENDHTYYTFSTKIRKDRAGECYVKLYNSQEEYIISMPMGESAYYKEFEIKELLPKESYYIVEFYGSTDSNATFTDNMFSIGSYKSQWTQANGEVMNTQVNVNVDGVLVKSSVYLGDYTVMSPLEFAGYSNINGTITKIFSLNKDTTKVKKLLAEDEVKMLPIKIIPITEGELQGWAFVPTNQGG